MFKNKILRRTALLVSLIMLLTSTVNTTFGFIVTKTDSLFNTFVPFDGILSDLLIGKTVEHPFGEEYVIPDNIAFDFKVDFGPYYSNSTIKTTAGNFVADENGSITVSVKPGTQFGAEGIDAGTKVTVTEVQKDGDGFTVKDGAVTKEATVSENGSIKLEFINIYTPASVQPLNVTVHGTKILEGREWQTGDTFSFVLEQNTEDDTWATLGVKTIIYDSENEGFNNFDFSDLVQTLTFDKIGTYSFRMTELIGDLENVDYDKTVNTFAIKVTDFDMDGRLEVHNISTAQNVTATSDNGNFDVSVIFNNLFVPPTLPDPDDITVTITVNKSVENTGELTIPPSGFEFVLENVNSGEKFALDTDEYGKVIFSLPFSAVDIDKTYSYKLYETNEGAVGVTYDTDVHNITIAISLGDDNELIATMTIDGNAVDSLTADFENIYHADNPDILPTGDKSNLTFWVIMMIVSAMACTVLILIDRKYRSSAKC